MKKLFVMVALGLVVLAASCDTKNIGNLPWPARGPIVTVSHPAQMNGSADAVWTFSWVQGSAPYSITINMGGGANPNTWTEANVTSPFTHTFNMVNASLTADANYTYTVTVTDGQGLSNPVSAQYTVGPTLNQPPTVTATISGKTVTAVVSDPDDDGLTVTAAATGGLTVSPASTTAAAPYPANLTFSVSAPLAGGTGDVTITVNDGHNADVSATVTATIPAVALAADTLYAVPSANSTTVGTPVTVTVMTGVPANAFLYVNGVGVTVQGAVDAANKFITGSGAYYEPNTFNVGSPGGAKEDSDGIWTTLGTSAFITASDLLINRGTDIGGGRVRLDFNVTPLDGAESTTASGDLFNFGLNFGVAGTYTLGFQQFATVKRTYFSNAAATEFFWGTLEADETGAKGAGIAADFDNAIVVN